MLACCRSLSPHSNYAGNLMLWSGIWLLNAPRLSSSTALLIVSTASPIFLTALFYGQATGTITNAVGLAQQKYGADPSFAKYVQGTPLIFPYLY
eukprot:SAG11_NODE_2079_length_3855_cov_1.533280_5_plen_94_part_00